MRFRSAESAFGSAIFSCRPFQPWRRSTTYRADRASDPARGDESRVEAWQPVQKGVGRVASARGRVRGVTLHSMRAISQASQRSKRPRAAATQGATAGHTGNSASETSRGSRHFCHAAAGY